MYNYNQTSGESAYEQPYGTNYESGSQYELLPELEMNDESEFDNEYNYEYNNEYTGEQEEESFETQYEQDYEYQGEQDYESEQDYENEQYESESEYSNEMDSELEYVTNEEEFSNWVNEVVVRDHRTRSLQPVLRTPLGQQAVRSMSNIASRRLPFLGRRRGGWTRPYNYRYRQPHRYANRYQHNRHPHNRYGHRRWHRHPHHWRRNYSSQPWQQPFPTQFQQQPFEPMSQGMDSMPQQTTQNGNFTQFVLDTLKNLSEQIAMGNQSISALKDSMANSAANNMPSIVQPKPDTQDQPPAGDTPPPPQNEPAKQSEYDMEDFEFGMEAEEGEVTDSEGSFSEETELQLASELLSLRNESELDHFIGGLISKAVGAARGLLKTAEGKTLLNALKGVAQKALPIAGGAIGTFFGGPAGGALGANIGKAVVSGEIFEMQLEGLSNEDQEFEVARAFVRFGGNAARQVADHEPGDPQESVRHGITEAATMYAPGLLVRRRRRGYYQ